MSSSESGKNWLESTKISNPFGRNWFESTENMNLSEKANNGYEMAKNGFGKSKSWVEEKVRAQGISDEQRSLLIKSGGSLLLSTAIAYNEGFGSAFRFILASSASDDDCCKMAQNKLEMAKNRSETAKSLAEMAKNGYGTNKSWAEEKIRATGISDEHRDLAVKAGGALLLAAATGYYGGLGGVCGFLFRGGGGSGDREKLMKAPGRPGEFMARASFEASPKAYFRGLHGKL